MNCPRCQHEHEAGAKFCEECAEPADEGETDGHFAAAATLYREMDMGFYLTQAEAELGPTR